MIFYLNGTSAGFDHLFSEQISGFFVTKTGIYISNDGDYVGFIVIDLPNNAIDIAAFSACLVKGDKNVAQFTCIGLFEERIDLFDQSWNRGFFVHALVWQGTEL